MEGCNVPILAQLANASASIIRSTLKSDDYTFEVTKSLVNVLYNLVIVGSIPADSYTKSFLDRKAQLVLALVSRSKPLWWKHQQLIHNPALVQVIAKSCPNVA